MLPPPSSGAFVFAWLNRARAGSASNARISAVMQSVIGHIVLANVRPHIVVRPVDKRIHLHELVAFVPLDFVHGGACDRLFPPKACNPRVEPRQGASQWLHLADAAA